jgi:hypothetical protein
MSRQPAGAKCTGYCPRLGLMCGRLMVEAMDAFCHPHRVRGVAGMWITASRHGCAQPARDATGCPSPKQLESRLPCSRPSDGVKFSGVGGLCRKAARHVAPAPGVHCRAAVSSCMVGNGSLLLQTLRQWPRGDGHSTGEQRGRRQLATRGASSSARARLCAPHIKVAVGPRQQAVRLILVLLCGRIIIMGHYSMPTQHEVNRIGRYGSF